MLCTCAGCSGLRSVYHCQPTQLAKEAFLQGRRLEDNQSIRKTPMLIGTNKMLGYSIAVVVHSNKNNFDVIEKPLLYKQWLFIFS